MFTSDCSEILLLYGSSSIGKFGSVLQSYLESVCGASAARNALRITQKLQFNRFEANFSSAENPGKQNFTRGAIC
jgi:hypothetical protein